MNTEEKLICALLSGEAETGKRAKYLAESYKNCPYINLIATKQNKFFATYFLPKRQRWWIETIVEMPKETIGLEKAEVTIVDDIYYPRELEIRIPDKPQEISPCGSNCKTCSAYRKCRGCPATVFYKEYEY